MQRRTAVTAYFPSKQLPLFAFAVIYRTLCNRKYFKGPIRLTVSLGAGQQEIPTVVLQHASVDTAGPHAWIAYSAGALCLQELPSIRYVSTKGPNSQRNQRPNMTMRRVCCFLSTPPPPPTHTHTTPSPFPAGSRCSAA